MATADKDVKERSAIEELSSSTALQVCAFCVTGFPKRRSRAKIENHYRRTGNSPGHNAMHGVRQGSPHGGQQWFCCPPVWLPDRLHDNPPITQLNHIWASRCDFKQRCLARPHTKFRQENQVSAAPLRSHRMPVLGASRC